MTLISPAINQTGIFRKALHFHWLQIAALVLIAAAATMSLISQLANATVSAGSPKALMVQHDQFGWLGHAQQLTMTIPDPKGRLVALSFDADFNDNFSIQSAIPAANTIAKSDTGQTFKFQSIDGKDLTVKLSVRARHWGYNTGIVRAVVPETRAADVRVAQHVLP